MSNMIRNAPKRRIERIRSTVIHDPIIGGATVSALHTCEDAKTLVRILIDGHFVTDAGIAIPTTVFGSVTIHIEPAGTSVVALPTAQSLDQPVPVQEIACIPFMPVMDTSQVTSIVYPVYRDISAQRKLKEGDVVALTSIAASTNSLNFVGVIYLWFKE